MFASPINNLYIYIYIFMILQICCISYSQYTGVIVYSLHTVPSLCTNLFYDTKPPRIQKIRMMRQLILTLGTNVIETWVKRLWLDCGWVAKAASLPRFCAYFIVGTIDIWRWAYPIIKSGPNVASARKWSHSTLLWMIYYNMKQDREVMILRSL